MEPLTHFLTGACLARAGFNRKAALATATMTLAAEAPDIDVIGNFKDPVFELIGERKLQGRETIPAFGVFFVRRGAESV